MEYTINSEYIKDIILNKCPWDNKYPYNEVGILMWLSEYKIYISIYPVNDRYIWIGEDRTHNDIFSVDYNEYQTFNDVLNSALIESVCYLSLKNNK